MKKVLNASEILSIIGLIAILILTLLQAVMRSFFSRGLPWTNEVLAMAHIVAVYMILPVLFYDRENVCVDVFFHLLPKKLWNTGWIVIELICLAFGIAFFGSISLFLYKTWTNTQAITRIPNYIFYGGIWVGMLCSDVCLIMNIVDSIRGKKEAK